MRKSIKATLAGAATVAAMATAFIGINATGASAMDLVPCKAPDYMKLTTTLTSKDNPNAIVYKHNDACYANGGQSAFPDPAKSNYKLWMTHLWTGNNHVQYFADGRWQPDKPYDPNSDLDFGGGIVIEQIRIV